METRTHPPAVPAALKRLYVGLNDFPAGRSSRGTLNDWALSLTLAGGARYEDFCDPFELRRDSLLLVRPGTPQFWHVPRADSPADAQRGYWRVVYVVFSARSHWQSWLSWPEFTPGYIDLTLRDPSIASKVRRVMLRLHRLAKGGLVLREDFALNALEQVLLWCRSDQVARQVRLDSRVEQAVERLTTEFAYPWTLPKLAAAVHCSRSHLALLFHRQIGVTPMAFLEQQRLDRATQMLCMTAEPISVIARQVGFEDPRYFAKRFKQHRGQTPRQCRQDSVS